MVNVHSQQKYYSLAEVRQLLPGTPHISTIHRWMGRGVRGVRLVATLIGGRRYIHNEALQDFLREINNNQTEATVNSQSSSSLRNAEAALDREGIR